MQKFSNQTDETITILIKIEISEKYLCSWHILGDKKEAQNLICSHNNVFNNEEIGTVRRH